jgi:hypothetical protein
MQLIALGYRIARVAGSKIPFVNAAHELPNRPDIRAQILWAMYVAELTL